MKKLSLSFILSLLLSIVLIFSSCTPETTVTPPAPDTSDPTVAETTRKEAVLGFVANAAGGEEATPIIPAFPTGMDAFAEIYHLISQIPLHGTVYISSEDPTSETPAELVPYLVVTVKDGAFCLDFAEESASTLYGFLDEEFNIVMVNEGKNETLLENHALLDYLCMGSGGSLPTDMLPVLPEEGYELPKLPTMTADDLVVTGNQVSLTPAYIKSVTDTLIAAYGELYGMELTSPEFIEMAGSINTTLSMLNLDAYFTTTNEGKVNGYAIHITDKELPGGGYPAQVVRKDITLTATVDPTTFLPLTTEVKAEVAPDTSISTKVVYTYLEDALQTVDVTAEVSKTGYADPDSRKIVSTYALTMKANVAGLSLAEAELLNADLSYTSVYADAPTEDPVSTNSITLTVSKAGSVYTAEATLIGLAENPIIYTFVTDFSEEVVFPTMSATVQTYKEAGENFYAHQAEVGTIANALTQIGAATPSGGYLYYYDAACNASFWISPINDGTDGLWEVRANAAAEAEDSISIEKLPNGSYAPIVEPAE